MCAILQTKKALVKTSHCLMQHNTCNLVAFFSGSSEMVQYTGVSVREDNPPGTSTEYHHRAVLKNGTCNLYPSHVAQHKWRFVQDSVTTIVDMQWRYALSLCVLSFFCSWAAFAVLWWLIAYVHGDFEKANQVSLCKV